MICQLLLKIIIIYFANSHQIKPKIDQQKMCTDCSKLFRTKCQERMKFINQIPIKNNNKRYILYRFGQTVMKRHINAEDQAVMNLLFLGDDQYGAESYGNYPNHEFKVLNEDRHKFKSNTIHLKTFKNSFRNTSSKIQSEPSSLNHTNNPSFNKENLKKILEKLENSPSPPRKRIEKSRLNEFGRVQTVNSQQLSIQKSKYSESKTPQFTKKSLDKLFDKKKQKDFIKSLIKAKIVEKLKKIQSKKSDKKVYDFEHKLGALSSYTSKGLRKQRITHLGTEKSSQRSKYTKLLRQEQHINHPLFSHKNSKVNLKKLLF